MKTIKECADIMPTIATTAGILLCFFILCFLIVAGLCTSGDKANDSEHTED